jgi:hypothetical protein
MADRFTIVPGDRLVIVNGQPRAPVDFTIDPAIRAVQGYEDGRIVVEFAPVSFREQMLTPLNETTRDLSAFKPALDAWAAWVPPPPHVPPPDPLSQTKGGNDSDP